MSVVQRLHHRGLPGRPRDHPPTQTTAARGMSPESPHYSQDLTLYGGCPPRVLTRRGQVCGVSGLLQRASGDPAEQAPGESPEPQPLGRGQAAPECPGRRQDQGALHPRTWDMVPHTPGCLGSRGSSLHSCLYLLHAVGVKALRRASGPKGPEPLDQVSEVPPGPGDRHGARTGSLGTGRMLRVSDSREGAPEEDPSPPREGSEWEAGASGGRGGAGNGLSQGGACTWGQVTERPKCPSEAR
ncbi:unnamed protein product [Rangifer tarandus platyrhynchus]|uniref:Uncharacterized protein n=1 Tax=Rangifer tarandus platyrhynchus TaxID=3082113 RepID=A0AC59YHK8_RANTA